VLSYDDFSIRIIRASDKNRILQWRNSDRVRFNMYNDHLISEQEHEDWFARALVDTNAIYLIFSCKEKPIGFISVTNINNFHNRCYWAFYLGETDVSRGVGSVMEFFAIDYAFLTLKIRKVCCEVFAFNASVIRLHEKFGFVQEGRFVKHYLKNGQYEDIVCLAKFGNTWNDERKIFKSRIFDK
jgi:UDP-4-amino-4,6-dideoxy-N-acetyl-beta-L-altrosamine N-acetyltransferase